MAEVVILGAGLTGLCVALHLEEKGFYDFKIFEKENSVGGLLRSFYHDGFTFDFTGHLLHTNNDYFYNFLEKIAGINNFNPLTRKSFIHLNNKIIPYPFQINLGNLDPEITIDSILGFIDRKKNIKKPKSYYEWVLKYFGSGMGKHFFFPYNQKLLCYDTKKITSSWTGRFIPQTNLKTILRNTLNKSSESNIGYNRHFYYPKNGGIIYLIDQITKKLKSKIHTNYTAEKIDTKNKTVYFQNGHKEKYNTLVNTTPLNSFLNSFEQNSSTNLKRTADKLLCNSLFNFNVGFDVANLTDKHWIYFPETKYPFYRIGFWHNICPTSVPKNCSAIYGELSYLPGTKTEKQVYNLAEKSIKSATKVLGLNNSNIITQKNLHIPHAYVIYNFWREKNLKKLLAQLEKISIYSTGRYGEWKYSSMQEAVLDGKKTSENLLHSLGKLNRKTTSPSQTFITTRQRRNIKNKIL